MKKNNGIFGVAIDIGTTNVQAKLVNLDTNEIIGDFSALNNQRDFGADVITRINAAQNGKLNELFSIINNQTEGILQHFICKHNLCTISKCAVSGNTTMHHLFCCIDPSSMGQAPYTPIFLDARNLTGKELNLSAEQINLLPGISAFIGADITVGLTFVDIMNSGEDVLFIDIGTNGEIVVWKESEKRLLCCSAAAGPCFEEAEISCGLNAADLINAIAEMKRNGVIDETGALLAKEKHITQKDIRQFQLAKSAVFSGIKTICKTAKLDLKNIGTVYIAGGLGFHLNLANAAELGLIPWEFAGKANVKVKVCGNTSLNGAVQSLTDKSFLQRCSDIISCAEVLELTNDKYFSAAFLHNLSL